jgi:hypothetical protein
MAEEGWEAHSPECLERFDVPNYTSPIVRGRGDLSEVIKEKKKKAGI